MLYLLVATMVYAWTALDLIQSEPPADLREALGGVLLCALLALMWPPVLMWRVLLGPASDPTT